MRNTEIKRHSEEVKSETVESAQIRLIKSAINGNRLRTALLAGFAIGTAFLGSKFSFNSYPSDKQAALGQQTSQLETKHPDLHCEKKWAETDKEELIGKLVLKKEEIPEFNRFLSKRSEENHIGNKADKYGLRYSPSASRVACYLDTDRKLVDKMAENKDLREELLDLVDAEDALLKGKSDFFLEYILRQLALPGLSIAALCFYLNKNKMLKARLKQLSEKKDVEIIKDILGELNGLVPIIKGMKSELKLKLEAKANLLKKLDLPEYPQLDADPFRTSAKRVRVVQIVQDIKKAIDQEDIERLEDLYAEAEELKKEMKI